MGDRTVTVVVTVYNIEPYLERFFECLSRQSVQDYEVLMIDDGSTDKSLDILNCYAQKDSRIRVIPSHHIGISAARNLALQNIRTELVTSLDGDDWFEEDYLKHLLDAQEKYDADLVISNVVYHYESGREMDRFCERREELFTREQFPEILPELLRERRMNYLYGKLFKRRYLEGIRVKEDVMQGSDTRINFRYAVQIASIAVIEDYDYHYIKYRSRSVTSYNGKQTFNRLYRINSHIYHLVRAKKLLNTEMLKALDERVLESGYIAVEAIIRSSGSFKEKSRCITEIIQSKEYTRSYFRYKRYANTEALGFPVLIPGEEQMYLKIRYREEAPLRRKDAVRKLIPDFVLELRRKRQK